MSKERKKILTIAGFDPSGGAGILADIKTFESHRCLGFAVNTANTLQNENEFLSPNWIDEEEVFSQLDIILKKHQFEFVKIGLIPSLDFLKKLINKLSIVNCQLIWDPILSTSTNFNFNHDLSELNNLLKGIYMVTPNWEEVKQLTGSNNAMAGAEALSKLTNVYLKGGHNIENPGKDYLFFDEETYMLNPKAKKPIFEKHGSGCVFSSTLAANLTRGLPMLKACLKSKRYMEHFLGSSPELLGYHKL